MTRAEGQARGAAADRGPGRAPVSFGLSMWVQATSWPEILRMARHCDEAGFDHVWVYDHLLGIVGPADLPNFEAWTTLAAIAASTRRAEVGLLVGSNTYRNPGLVAKMAVTVDHISGGRCILGLGSGWAEREHTAYGLPFGRSVGERLDWLDEAVAATRALLDGGSVTSKAGDRYAFSGLRLVPGPVRERLPIMIGGAGERKTLRTVARSADLWNLYREPAEYARLSAVLAGYCAEIGRDDASVERTLGLKIVVRDSEAEARRAWQRQTAANGFPPDWRGTIWLGTAASIAERLSEYVAIGCRTFIVEMPAPYDLETASRLMAEVKPLLAGSHEG